MGDRRDLRLATGDGVNAPVQTARVADAVPVEVSPKSGGPPPEDPVLRAGWRRLRWLIGGMIALALAVTSSWVVFEASGYEARTALLIRAPGGKAGVPQAVDGALQSERELLRSFEVLRRTQESIGVGRLYPDLQGDSIGSIRAEGVTRMRDALSVETPRGTDVIEVAFRHDDPELAALVVNRLVKRFERARQSVLTPAVSRHRLLERIEEQEAALEEAEAALTAFLEDHPGLADGGAHAARAEQRAKLERDLRTERWITAYLEEEPLDDPSIHRARSRLEQLELELQAVLGVYEDDARTVRDLRQKIAHVRSQLEAREWAATRKREREILHHRERAERLEAALADYEAAERAVPALERERRDLVRARDLALRRLDVYQREFEGATLEAEVGRHRLAAAMHVLTRASPPEGRTVRPDQARLAWALLGIALVLVVALILADVVDDHRRKPVAPPVLFAAKLGKHPDGTPIALRVPEALVADQRSR
jgi:uncharacterized protein involved in exopolysaccharide biosynthesis